MMYRKRCTAASLYLGLPLLPNVSGRETISEIFFATASKNSWPSPFFLFSYHSKPSLNQFEFFHEGCNRNSFLTIFFRKVC